MLFFAEMGQALSTLQRHSASKCCRDTCNLSYWLAKMTAVH